MIKFLFLTHLLDEIRPGRVAHVEVVGPVGVDGHKARDWHARLVD